MGHPQHGQHRHQTRHTRHPGGRARQHRRHSFTRCVAGCGSRGALCNSAQPWKLRGTAQRFRDRRRLRHHPQWHRVRELVRAGRIGTVRSIQSAFLFTVLPARVIALIDRDAKLGVDTLTSGLLEFPGGGQLAFTSALQSVAYQRVTILGTDGRIELPVPFTPSKDWACRITIDSGKSLDGSSAQFEDFPAVDQYALQCDTAAAVFLDETQQEFPIEDGIANMRIIDALFGMYGGILVIAVPQLLSARHVPEATIAAMTAAAISPGFWTFLVSPVLDVRFSRRWYSVVTALLSAVLLALALTNLENLVLVEILLVAGFFFANLYQSALGGWLSSIVTGDEEHALSVWVTIANISGGGAMAMVTGEIVQSLSATMAALVLAAIVLLPTVIFCWMPAPGPDRRLARESFPQFFADVVSLLKRREILIAIVLFIAPASTFSLVNILGGLGNDFHTSTHFVGLLCHHRARQCLRCDDLLSYGVSV
jgi:hypothetical protein